MTPLTFLLVTNECIHEIFFIIFGTYTLHNPPNETMLS